MSVWYCSCKLYHCDVLISSWGIESIQRPNLYGVRNVDKLNDPKPIDSIKVSAKDYWVRLTVMCPSSDVTM